MHRYIYTLMMILVVSLHTLRAYATNPDFLNNNADSDTGNDINVQMVTDNAGVWMAIWESNDTLGDSIGIDEDILFSISTDNGSSWTAPAALNSDAGDGADNDNGVIDKFPHLTTDFSGNWIAVWESDIDGTDTDILYSVSTNDGASWSASAKLNSLGDSDDAINDYLPRITTNHSGVWMAVWESEDSQDFDLDIHYSVSVNNGTSWSASSALNSNASTDVGDDQRPMLNTDGAGTWISTWYSYDTISGTLGNDVDILFSKSTDNGSNWSIPSALNTNAASDSGNDFDPQITTDFLGNWIAVWVSDETLGNTVGSDVDVFYSTSEDDGSSWSFPAALNPNASTDSEDDAEPQVVTDALGTWVTLWWSYEDVGSSIGVDSDILFSISNDSGASWSQVGVLNGNATNDLGGGDFSPQLTTDSSGNWIASWDSDDTLGDTIDVDDDILFQIWNPVINEVWYVPDASTNGTGTEISPFNDIGSAITALQENGTLHVPDGLISEEYTLSKPMIISE